MEHKRLSVKAPQPLSPSILACTRAPGRYAKTERRAPSERRDPPGRQPVPPLLRRQKDREKRREERTASSDNPMAVSTWEGIGCSVCRQTQPNTAGRQVPATASALPPYIRQTPDWKYWEYVPFRRNAPSRRPPVPAGETQKNPASGTSRPATSSKCLNAARAAAPKPMIPGTFSVPDLKPYSCPPPNSKGEKGAPALLYRHPIPLGPWNLCADTEA